MSDTRYEDPEYHRLRQLVREGLCVAFVGSGLSALDGLYPTWDQLIKRLCQECAVDPGGPTEYQDVDALLDLADKARQNDPKAYWHVLKDVFGHTHVLTRRAYDLLMRLKLKSYVTTNFDPLLATESRKREHDCNGVYEFPALPVDRISFRAVYYIHGRVKEGVEPKEGEILLGRSDFERAYDDSAGTLGSFLHQVLTFQPLFFIGCTLREPPLKHIFERCHKVREQIQRDWPEQRAPERYALLPTRYRKESKSLGQRDTEAEYEETGRFRELDIRVVRYVPKDERHSAIEEILEEWCSLPPISDRCGFEKGDMV